MPFPTLHNFPLPMRERNPAMTALVPMVNQLLGNLDRYLEDPDRNHRNSLRLIVHLIRTLDSIYTKVIEDQSEELSQWYFINAENLSQILEVLADLPECTALSPDLNRLLVVLRDPHRNFLGSYSDSINQAAKKYQADCTKITGSVSAAATALSACSFLATPIVGAIVTGSTALVGGVSTAASALFSYQSAKKSTEKNAIEAIYRNFNVNNGS